MRKQKSRIKLEKYLDSAAGAVRHAVNSKSTVKYNKLMERVIRQYKKIAKKAENLTNYYLKPLIKIDKKIICELKKYNEFKKSDPALMRKSIKKGKTLFKRIEDCLIFNHDNKTFLQVGKSLLAHIVLLCIMGIIVSNAKGESDTGVDYNNLPKTIEDSDIEQFAAYDEDKAGKGSIESNKSLEETVPAGKTENIELIKNDIPPKPTKVTALSTEKEGEIIEQKITEDVHKNTVDDFISDNSEDTAEEKITSPPVEINKNIQEDYSGNNQNEYEILIVEKGNTLWGITKKYYRNFSEGKIYIFIDKLLSPLNNKGRIDDYQWGDPDERNPHRIYPSDEIKVPNLSEVDPLSIPKELRDMVKLNIRSVLYSAKGIDGRIILINHSEKKIAIIS